MFYVREIERERGRKEKKLTEIKRWHEEKGNEREEKKEPVSQ